MFIDTAKSFKRLDIGKGVSSNSLTTVTCDKLGAQTKDEIKNWELNACTPRSPPGESSLRRKFKCFCVEQSFACNLSLRNTQICLKSTSFTIRLVL